MGSGHSNAISKYRDAPPCHLVKPTVNADEIANLNAIAMKGIPSNYMAVSAKGPKWIYRVTKGEIETDLALLHKMYIEELNLAKQFLQVCQKYNGIMIPNVMSTYLKNDDDWVKQPVTYSINGILTATIDAKCNMTVQWREDGHSVQSSSQPRTLAQNVGFKQEMNENYFINHNQRMNDMNMAIKDIRNRSTDYCSNPTTLLSVSGMDTCGMNTAWANMKTNISPAIDASKKSLSSIKDTDDYLQYDITKPVNDKLTAINNHNPMSSTKTVFNVYNNVENDLTVSTSNMEQQNQYITTNTKYAKDSYNNCALPGTTLLSTNANNIPNCVQSKYVPATNTCSKAIQMSKKYDYEPGTTALTGLWEDVTNNIPGNIMSTTTTVLANSNDSCQKWVDMFNVWEEKEKAAMSTPCFPERPIASTNDKTFINIAENWRDTNNKLIDSLIARLKVIETYVQNYPNILEIKPETIQFAPSSLPATVMLTQTKNKAGVAPTQNINMIIPNGKPGAMGEQGYTGIAGDKSLPGANGADGKAGNPALPP